MWDHVEMQLLTFPGGVGNNLEDWVEQRHQTGKRHTELSKYIKDDGKIRLHGTKGARVEQSGGTTGAVRNEGEVNKETKLLYACFKEGCG